MQYYAIRLHHANFFRGDLVNSRNLHNSSFTALRENDCDESSQKLHLQYATGYRIIESTNGASHNQPRGTMTQKNITIGSEVVRTKGKWDYIGRIGTVIEMDGERARVDWTHQHSYLDGSIILERKRTRTWLKVDSLHPTSIPYTLEWLIKPFSSWYSPARSLRFQII